MPHERTLRAIELFGTEVAPVVRREVERQASPLLAREPLAQESLANGGAENQS